MFKKILVALDQSPSHSQVFTEAVDLAKATNALLMMVHVMSPFDVGYPNSPVFPIADGIYPTMHSEAIKDQVRHWNECEAAGRKFLQQLAEEAIATGVAADYTQAYGDVGKTICQLATSWEADLIVVGRRGLKGLGELLMGSVSNYVLHHATCTVLTVQKQVLEQEEEESATTLAAKG